MRYLLAIVLPPIAVLSTGRIFQALLNVVLTLFFWVPGVIHAALLVNDYHAERRMRRLEQALRMRATW